MAPDLDGEYGLSATDLRHRTVLSGIWEVRGGFQVSATLRNLGASAAPIKRLRPDGSLVPRNSLTQPSRSRTNVRRQRRIPLPRQASIDLIAEAFDVFNRPNFTIGTQENNVQYGQPISGLYRTMQLGFRVLF